ncbi:MAG: hypothetical protein PWP37_546 [Thermotogota bacterium]|nr:hypothetical protein [Thermotogota bacterium]MDK2864354.1 hypothetical protein [Thermotogota bacterium]
MVFRRFTTFVLLLLTVGLVFCVTPWEEFWSYNSSHDGQGMLTLISKLENSGVETLNATDTAILAYAYTEYANWGLPPDDPEKERLYEKALEYADRAIDKDENNAFAHYVKGATIGRLAQYKGIIQSLFMLDDFDRHILKAIELDPNNFLAYVAMGMRYRDTPWPFRSYRKAESYLKKAIEIEPRYVNAYYELAVLYELMKRYDEARQLYEKILEIEPHPFFVAQAMETKEIAEKWLEEHK